MHDYKLSLYFHIPVCLKKCAYCSFHSVEKKVFPLAEYVHSLVEEIRLCRKTAETGSPADTLYFGGGTPSILDPIHLEKLIVEAERQFGVAPGAEITIEANPGTLDREKAVGFRRVGANRLSLGIQSFDDQLLKKLGRVHSAAQAREAFDAARAAGFDNIGIDLIHSLPGESLAQWKADLLSATGLEPEHISLYGLTVEEGTEFGELEKRGDLFLPDDEESAEMYETAVEILERSGYRQYEISNFARPGFMSRHNQAYWKRTDSLGFGSGAHSFRRGTGFGVRWHNVRNIEEYLALIEEGELPRREIHSLTHREAMGEALFLGLRMLDGVDLLQFRKDFGIEFQDAYPRESRILLDGGLLEMSGHNIRLTPKSLLISNQVFLMFV